MDRIIEKAAILMEALPYIQEFRNSIVVVKLGGSVIEEPQKTRGVIRDIVFMECAGMKPLIVHGGGKAISRRLEQAGIKSCFIEGLRYTSEAAVKVVDDVLHNQVNASLFAIMNEFNGHPESVSGKDIIKARQKTVRDSETGKSRDLGHVGEIEEIDTAALISLLNKNIVPIITPLARGEDGRIYNTNADTAACRIAASLQARKLAFLSDVPGILKDKEDENSLISTMHLSNIEDAINKGVIASGMVPKVRSAAEAVRAGTGKVHMIDGRIRHSLLLEIFTKKGIGTQILNED